MNPALTVGTFPAWWAQASEERGLGQDPAGAPMSAGGTQTAGVGTEMAGGSSQALGAGTAGTQSCQLAQTPISTGQVPAGPGYSLTAGAPEWL